MRESVSLYKIGFIPVSLRGALLPLLSLGLLVAWYENSLAFSFFVFFWLLLGSSIIFMSFDRRRWYQSFNVFFLVFLVYLLYMLTTNYLYVTDPHIDFFYNPDSVKFFSRIDRLAQIAPAKDMYSWMEGYYILDWKGFGAITWSIASISEALGDSNSIVVQKLQIVFFSSTTIVFLLNIFNTFLPRKQAFSATICFAFLSHIMFLSGVFMRDIHILCFYTIAFYIVLQRWSILNLLVLFGLFFLVYQLRSHNGIFFLSFIALFIYFRARNLQPKLANAILVCSVILILAIVAVLGIGSVNPETGQEIDSYSEYHGQKFESASGLTSLIGKAPAIIRPFMTVSLSQIYPFPVYRGMYVNYIDEYQYLLFPLCIAQVFWIFVIVFLIYGLTNKSFRMELPTKLKFLLALSILFILVVGGISYEFRRLVVVYPVIFLCSSIFFLKAPKPVRRRIIRRTAFVYIATLFLYVILTI